MPAKDFGLLANKPSSPLAGDEYTATDTSQKFTCFSVGVFTDDGIASSDFILHFGGSFGSTGTYSSVNGTATSSALSALDHATEATIPKAGTLNALGWNTKLGDATTVIKIHKNGSVVETITLSGAQGADTTLNTTVAVGDKLAVEYDAGTAPNEGTYQVYI